MPDIRFDNRLQWVQIAYMSHTLPAHLKGNNKKIKQ